MNILKKSPYKMALETAYAHYPRLVVETASYACGASLKWEDVWFRFSATAKDDFNLVLNFLNSALEMEMDVARKAIEEGEL